MQKNKEPTNQEKMTEEDRAGQSQQETKEFIKENSIKTFWRKLIKLSGRKIGEQITDTLR